MSHLRPEKGCYDIDFEAAYPLGEGAEVALEDYARALARAGAAEAPATPCLKTPVKASMRSTPW